MNAEQESLAVIEANTRQEADREAVVHDSGQNEIVRGNFQINDPPSHFAGSIGCWGPGG